ncbi:hypothetical protein BLNAU_7928 [Blattamonas nauphoetae]|uniref:Uncharacterized protein n=1 Tax=Blattamonas nauphoetae TaxID=2049346 RepID=A0ABQ9Y054_9EUKA|nr:hypothetical protein BLNAU_7928 [Blattamonas nauphoetae]
MENPQYSFKNRIVLFTTRIPPPHPQLNEVLLTLTANNIELTIVHLPSCEPPSLIGTSFQSSTLLVPASTNQFTSLLSFSTLLADHPSVSLHSLTSSTNIRHRLAALFDSYLVEILGEKKHSGNPLTLPTVLATVSLSASPTPNHPLLPFAFSVAPSAPFQPSFIESAFPSGKLVLLFPTTHSPSLPPLFCDASPALLPPPHILFTPLCPFHSHPLISSTSIPSIGESREPTSKLICTAHSHQIETGETSLVVTVGDDSFPLAPQPSPQHFFHPSIASSSAPFGHWTSLSVVECLPLEGVCDSLTFGTPFLLSSSTSSPLIEHDYLETNDSLFLALVRHLDTHNLCIICSATLHFPALSLHPSSPSYTRYFVLLPSSLQGKLLVKNLASAEQVIRQTGSEDISSGPEKIKHDSASSAGRRRSEAMDSFSVESIVNSVISSLLHASFYDPSLHPSHTDTLLSALYSLQTQLPATLPLPSLVSSHPQQQLSELPSSNPSHSDTPPARRSSAPKKKEKKPKVEKKADSRKAKGSSMMLLDDEIDDAEAEAGSVLFFTGKGNETGTSSTSHPSQIITSQPLADFIPLDHPPLHSAIEKEVRKRQVLLQEEVKGQGLKDVQAKRFLKVQSLFDGETLFSEE